MCLNETYSNIHIGKYLYYNFPIQECLKQEYALSPLLFNFALEYAVRKVQKNQVGLKLKETYQLMADADDLNLLGDSIHTVKKNTETSTDTTKEVGQEINVEKTMYMSLSHNQNTDQNHGIKVANR
jgi:hypothetical protein